MQIWRLGTRMTMLMETDDAVYDAERTAEELRAAGTKATARRAFQPISSIARMCSVTKNFGASACVPSHSSFLVSSGCL